jgi:hypothetical protein
MVGFFQLIRDIIKYIITRYKSLIETDNKHSTQKQKIIMKIMGSNFFH